MLTELMISLGAYLGIVDEDFEDRLIIDEDLDGAIALLRGHGLLPVFDDFLRFLSTLIANNPDDFLNGTYATVGTVHLIDFNAADLNKKNRAFSYSDQEFSFFSMKILIDGVTLVDFSDVKYALLWKQMQTYFERSQNFGGNTINIFFDCLRNNDVSKGFVVKYIGDDFEEERHYSYIYLSFLNSSRSVTLPALLNYSNNVLNPVLNYTQNIEYEQYFDIYDVINELNQAPDLLTRFLKLYHVLEYLMYRVYLVDLVGRVGRNKFFVREFITSSESMKKGEKETFIKNFVKIFGGDAGDINNAISGDVNPLIVTFLNDHGLVSAFAAGDINRIAQLIYSVRCSIVHNKESEYHLTISFYDDFLPIIPLVRSLIRIIEKLMIEKIKTNHGNIKYPQRGIQLY